MFMSKFYEEKPGPYRSVKKESSGSADEFFGSSWSIKREKDRFVLIYISGELAGRLKELEITKDEFESVRDGRLGVDELCLKYDAF